MDAIFDDALNGKNVLLVEDMLETGLSAQVARQFLEQIGSDVRLACYFTRDFSEVYPPNSGLQLLSRE